MIKEIFNQRRGIGETEEKQKVFVDYVLEEVDNKESFITEGIALDLVFLLLFASHETTSTAMTMAMKFITESPAVLAELVVSDIHNTFPI